MSNVRANQNHKNWPKAEACLCGALMGDLLGSQMFRSGVCKPVVPVSVTEVSAYLTSAPTKEETDSPKVSDICHRPTHGYHGVTLSDGVTLPVVTLLPWEADKCYGNRDVIDL